MKKSIIMGAATGYKPQNVELFLNSLNEFHYNGTVVLFVHKEQAPIFSSFYDFKNYSFRLEFVITQIGIKKMRKYRKVSRILLSPIIDFSKTLKCKIIYRLAYPHVSRFFDYYNYLASHNYDYVMLTDTRDVVVQQDPFINLPKGLYLGLEDNRVLIKNDIAYNARWIKEVYGNAKLNEIQDNEISCAGVTLGDYDSVMSYLKTMNDEFLRLPFSIMLKSNYDQGIHNKLLYSNQFENVVLCRPLNSVISTIGLIPLDELEITQDGKVLNAEGKLLPIVHQYDRYENINILIKNRLNSR